MIHRICCLSPTPLPAAKSPQEERRSGRLTGTSDTDVPHTFAASSSQARLAPESDSSHPIAQAHPAESGSAQYVDFAPQCSQPHVGHTHAEPTVDSLLDATTVEHSPSASTDAAELSTSIPVLSPPSTPRPKLRSRKCTISNAKTSRVAISDSSHPTMHSSEPSGIRALEVHNRALEPSNYQGFSSTFSGSLQPYDHISNRTNMKHRTGNGTVRHGSFATVSLVRSFVAVSDLFLSFLQHSKFILTVSQPYVKGESCVFYICGTNSSASGPLGSSRNGSLKHFSWTLLPRFLWRLPTCVVSFNVFEWVFTVFAH